MKITYLSIFPDLFDSFRSTTLISRAISRRLLSFQTINPRHFCDDKHRTIDDKVYGGGHGMLMKAPPIIAAIKHWITKNKLWIKSEKWKSTNWNQRHIIIPSPSQIIFCQQYAHQRSEYKHLLFICGRYEGIDERVRLRLQKKYPQHITKVSLWQFITLGGELPAMTITEAVVRLIPGVIKEEMSRIDESYSIQQWMSNIEYPQYTRPEVVEKMSVPDILLSGNHKVIAEFKNNHTTKA